MASSHSHQVFTGQIVSEAEVDRSLLKIFILIILTIGASFLVVYNFNRLLLDWSSFRFYFLLTLGSISLFLIFVILDIFFIKSFFKIFLSSILIAFGPLVVFYPHINSLLIIGAFFFFLFLVTALRRGMDFISNSLRLHFFRIASFVVPKVVTGLFIFLTLIFFVNYFDVEKNKFNENVNRLIVNQAVVMSEPLVRFFLPDFSLNLKTDEFLKMVLRKQIVSLVPDFERFLPTVQEKIFNETFKSFKANFEKTLGKIEGDKPLGESLYILFERYLNKLPQTSRLIFAVVFTLFLFLIIRGFAPLFYWVAILGAFLIFKILIILGFAYLSLESRSREFVNLT